MKKKKKNLFWFKSPPNALTWWNSRMYKVDNFCVSNERVVISVYIR